MFLWGLNFHNASTLSARLLITQSLILLIFDRSTRTPLPNLIGKMHQQNLPSGAAQLRSCSAISIKLSIISFMHELQISQEGSVWRKAHRSKRSSPVSLEITYNAWITYILTKMGAAGFVLGLLIYGLLQADAREVRNQPVSATQTPHEAIVDNATGLIHSAGRRTLKRIYLPHSRNGGNRLLYQHWLISFDCPCSLLSSARNKMTNPHANGWHSKSWLKEKK